MKPTKLFLLLLFISMPLFAGGGSLYTRFGIGDLRLSYSARTFGLGELGIALSDKDFINSINPASWNNLRLTRFETGILYNGAMITDGTSSVYQSGTYFNGLTFGIPVDHEYGIAAVVGLVPVSNVEYNFSQNIVDPNVDPYTINYQGSGGLQKFFLGTSYKLPFDFSLGLSYEYYIGRITNSSIVTFVTNSTFRNATFRKEIDYHGMGFTAGLISSDLSKYFDSKNFKDFRIGVVFTPTVSLTTDSLDNSVTSIGNIALATSTYNTKLPYKFGIGASFKWTDNYTFVLDYYYQKFSGFTENNVASSYLQDFYKMSFGFEYNNIETRSNSFWDHVMLRGGISYEKSQYKINGTGLNQYSVYTGVSMPLSYDNSVDFGFQYGVRGTTDYNLMRENFFKFTVALSIGELWFVRTEH